MSIGKVITKTSKVFWVGLAFVVALLSSSPAFAWTDCEYCNDPFWVCPSSCGDPHLRTENGVAYDFQGAGEFTLLRASSGLEIQARQTPVLTPNRPTTPAPPAGLASCVSLNTAVAVRMGKRRVSYQPKASGLTVDPSSLELRVDGTLQALGSGGLAYTDGSSILPTSSPGGLLITFPDKSMLQVTPAWWPAYSMWYLNLSVRRPKVQTTQPGTSTQGGLLSSIATGSWLPALPDGTSMGALPSTPHDRYVALYQKFADAWRVKDANSLFDYATGTTTASFTTSSWPPETGPCTITGKTAPAQPAKPTTEAIATNACSGVTAEGARKSCVFDVLVTGNLDFAKTYVAGQKASAGLTKIALTSAKTTTLELTPATFTVTVTPEVAGKGTPTGTVRFWGDGGVRATFPLDAKGQAVWTTDRIAAGVHTIMATYEPAAGSGFVAGSSQAITHTVQKK